MGAGVLLLLFDFDFFDTLRTSSSRTANSSLALSSSSLVFRRPLSKSSGGSNSIDSIEIATACCMLGADEGVDSERFKGAGAGLRKVRDGGLGKLCESGTGVASTMETTGALVSGVADGRGGVGGVTAFAV